MGPNMALQGGGRRDSLRFPARFILVGFLKKEGLVLSEPFSQSRLVVRLCRNLGRAGRPGARAEERVAGEEASAGEVYHCSKKLTQVFAYVAVSSAVSKAYLLFIFNKS